MTPFGQLFWGYLLFGIGSWGGAAGIAGVLGYLYAAHVLRRLVPHETGRSFRNARRLSFVLAAWSAFGVALAWMPRVSVRAASLPGVLSLVVPQVALNIFLTRLITEGILGMAVAQEKRDLARRARYTWYGYVFLSLAIAVLLSLIRVLPEDRAGDFHLPCGVALFLVFVLILLLLRKADRTLVLFRKVGAAQSRFKGRAPGAKKTVPPADAGVSGTPPEQPGGPPLAETESPP